jgi:hypothetical protein
MVSGVPVGGIASAFPLSVQFFTNRGATPPTRTTFADLRKYLSKSAASYWDRLLNFGLSGWLGSKAGHLSLISHPEEITRLILKAAGQQT